MNRFEDKVAVITGAGSGIGRALAVNLATKGAKLALSDIDPEGLAETVRLTEALGATVRSDRLNVAEREAVLAYTDAVDPETSMVICNDAAPEHGKGYQAHELGVPLVNDAEFMRFLDSVVGGTGIEEFTDTTLAGDQFALF